MPTRFIELFRTGTLEADYAIEASQPWVIITNASGAVTEDLRVEVGIDWDRAPVGSGEVVLTVTGSGSALARSIRLPIEKAPEVPDAFPEGFLELDGYIAIEAPNFDAAVGSNGIFWAVLPDYGRTLGGVTPYPVTAESITPGAGSPHLEYNVYLRESGELYVNLVTAPSLNFVPGRGLRCAVSFDDQTPQIVDVGGDVDDGTWAASVCNAVRQTEAVLESDAAGFHVLKVWMVDPGFVLQRVEVNTGGLPETYLGPQESPRGRRVAAAVSEEDDTATVELVTVQAESGSVGSGFMVSNAVPVFISIAETSAGYAPDTSDRVTRYQITFPEAGTYRLFARIRVGPESYNDDSFFFGNGFGAKTPSNTSQWKTINGLAGIGFASSSEVVYPASGSGSVGSQIWKWVDLSTLGNITFSVAESALTKTFDIGGREDGLDLDKLVFAPDGGTYTVDALNRGLVAVSSGSGSFSLEAESSTFGSAFSETTGSPSYISAVGTEASVPGSSDRVARFSAEFPAPGQYRLYARIRVGSGTYNDDSLFLGNGMGAKDPAASTDWIIINGLAGIGFSDDGDLVLSTEDGSAGAEVWKWVDLTKLSGAGQWTVSTGALSQMLDLGGREDGLDIDKLVFAPADTIYSVADLDTGGEGMQPSSDPVFTVDVADLHQEIDGFGASSAWTAQSISDAWADLFFSTNGIGLSLLRVRITPEGTTWETSTAQKAVARGAKVWATPWSPPAEWKDNGAVTNGGVLLEEYKDDWAQRLSDFVVNMNAAGVPLEAVSAQNEPNYTATWESCCWTPDELTVFVRDYLGPALVSNGLDTRVLAPETIGWSSLESYGAALLADASASAYLSHVGTHSYGSSVPFAYSAPADNGKRLWQTEYSDEGAESDPGIDSGLRVANDLHDFLTVAEGNAWNFWWLFSTSGESTGALVEGRRAGQARLGAGKLGAFCPARLSAGAAVWFGGCGSGDGLCCAGQQPLCRGGGELR